MRTLILFASSLFACATTEVDPIDGVDPGDLGEVDQPPGDDDVPPSDGELLVSPFDNDSEQAPALEQFLSITGTRELLHIDEVSSPTGDELDFVAFRLPQNSNTLQDVTITLTCSITGTPTVPPRATVFADGIRNVRSILCNAGPVRVTVDNTKRQVVRVELTNDTQAHMDYELHIDAF